MNIALLFLLDPAPALGTKQLETLHVCLLAYQLLVSCIALVHLHVYNAHHHDDGGHGEDGDDGDYHCSSPTPDMMFRMLPVHLRIVQLVIASSALLAESSLVPCGRHGGDWQLICSSVYRPGLWAVLGAVIIDEEFVNIKCSLNTSSEQ